MKDDEMLERYRDSDSDDDFQTWKIKEHIDSRTSWIVGVIIGSVVFLSLLIVNH